MAPERVERLITRVIEEQARTMSELNDIWSTSKRGESIVHFEVADEVPQQDLPATWKKLRNKLHDIAPSLPEGTIGPMVNDEFGDTAVATVALWSDGFTMAEMQEVGPRCQRAPGHHEGDQEDRPLRRSGRENLSRYHQRQVGPVRHRDPNHRRHPESAKRHSAGGRLDVEGTEVIVAPTGNFNEISEIESLLIPIPGTQRDGPAAGSRHDPPSLRRSAGQTRLLQRTPSIILSVILQQGVNAVDFGEELTKKLQEIEQSLPLGYVVEYATYQPDLIQKAVNGAFINVVETLVIVLIVVMIFLGVRTGMIVGSFVPLVMLMGLVIMGQMGIELQRMSIASMIIALGMLVDNGIVVAEDIRTRMQLGASAKEAAQKSGDSLSCPC